ncbi:hypothetical protein Xmau_02098 [Xenorhabdus mauleonii]|uniref:Uncharacterized protein n=1 Tax=Xenorhabdus mauleonii TaxID=351675 RepID=A0A2G0P0C7_9GAMM|nr:hypothetical protein Xmau_02098 [Xenorhabdus mauleonii]
MLVIQTPNIKLQTAVTTHRTIGIVQLLFHLPVLLSIVERHQLPLLIIQRTDIEAKLLGFNGTFSIIKCASQCKTAFSCINLRPNRFFVEQIIAINVPAAGSYLCLQCLNIALGLHGKMSAVNFRLSQANTAGLCRNHSAIRRQPALADIHPLTSQIDITFTQQAAACLDISLTCQC